MSAKRQATSDLNHDNWDKEEEPEERGQFRQASEDQLKTRVFKKATRRITGSEAGDGAGSAKSVFTGFTGFGKAAPSTATTAAASPFSFLSNLSGPSTSSAASSSATTACKATFCFGNPSSSPSTGTTPATTTQTKATSEAGGGDKAKTNTYNSKIVALNKAVSEWIKTHVDKDPLCILTPIFDDYAKYLKEIQAEDKVTTTTHVSPVKASGSESGSLGGFKFTSSAASSSSTSTAPASTSIFGNVSKPAESTPAKTNGFSFNMAAQKEKSPSTGSLASGSTSSGSFVFGKPAAATSSSSSTAADDKKPAGGFSFGSTSSTPFSFGNIKPPAAVAPPPASADNDDEEDEPPKVEFKQVVEEDAVYSKKCKVFVKKDGNFADRGVGTLYLKPVADSEKAQLLVRADTNLGNVLVNLILNEGIPAQRMGKNNVMLVCLPTPDMDKPTSMLLRVKTGEEADELLKWIEKYKK